MTLRQSLYVQAMHGGIVLAVVAAAAMLAYADKLDGQTVAVLLGAAITFAGGSAQSIGALGQAVNGKATIPVSELANREQTLRDALAASAGAQAHKVTASQVPGEPEEH